MIEAEERKRDDRRQECGDERKGQERCCAFIIQGMGVFMLTTISGCGAQRIGEEEGEGRCVLCSDGAGDRPSDRSS